MEKRNFRPPHRINIPKPIIKKFVTGDYVGDPYGCAKLGAYPSAGGFWPYGWNITKIIVCQMHLADYLITLVSVCPCVCVCPPIGCRTITSAILYRFSPNFACRSEMWLFQTLLFLGQTGSRLPILEMCKIQFWQFRDCGRHIFPRIVTKTRTEI